MINMKKYRNGSDYGLQYDLIGNSSAYWDMFAISTDSSVEDHKYI